MIDRMLPPDLLVEVLVLSGNPSFVRACKTLWLVLGRSQSPYVRARFLVQKYDRNIENIGQAVAKAQRWLMFNNAVLDSIEYIYEQKELQQRRRQELQQQQQQQYHHQQQTVLQATCRVLQSTTQAQSKSNKRKRRRDDMSEHSRGEVSRMKKHSATLGTTATTATAARESSSQFSFRIDLKLFREEMLPSSAEHQRLVRRVIGYGANPSSHNGAALTRCCAAGDLPMAHLLIVEAGVDVNIGGGHPLQAAAFFGHAEMAQWLLSMGAAPCTESLHKAIKGKQHQMVQLLISSGCVPDIAALRLMGIGVIV
ncbi:hypothetical protein GQ42DRAFT_81067 [Ramicandelaber brevisporus]|nr:hypothetical protein GQ42DRAFT_81067 [Ramicandelaber brevisporus]